MAASEEFHCMLTQVRDRVLSKTFVSMTVKCGDLHIADSQELQFSVMNQTQSRARRVEKNEACSCF